MKISHTGDVISLKYFLASIFSVELSGGGRCLTHDLSWVHIVKKKLFNFTHKLPNQI